MIRALGRYRSRPVSAGENGVRPGGPARHDGGVESTEEIVREDDGAVLGLVRPSADGRGWEPLTVFGYPLAAPTSRDEAVELVHSRGLSSLAEPWLVRVADGQWLSCELLEARPGWVRVRITDFGRQDMIYRIVVLQDPGADQLRPAARSRAS